MPTNKRKSSGNGWPSVVRFFVLRPFERSGVSFLPADHHLRSLGSMPSRLPSMGARGTGEVSLNTSPEIAVTVVPAPTGAVFEMAPEEIFEAVRTGTLAPRDPRDQALRRLLVAGAERGRSQAATLIPPMRRIYRAYETAEPPPYTAEGMAKRGTVGDVVPA